MIPLLQVQHFSGMSYFVAFCCCCLFHIVEHNDGFVISKQQVAQKQTHQFLFLMQAMVPSVEYTDKSSYVVSHPSLKTDLSHHNASSMPHLNIPNWFLHQPKVLDDEHPYDFLDRCCLGCRRHLPFFSRSRDFYFMNLTDNAFVHPIHQNWHLDSNLKQL